MFEFVRTHTRLFQFILVVLIFPSFVFFGIQGYTRFTEGGAQEVASVAGRGVTQAEWDAAHRRAVERVTQQMPGMDLKMFDTPAMRRETLDSLVRERLLLAAAQKENLLPGDERLQRLFRTDPQFAGFRNADGSVNRDLLAAQGMTSDMFAQQLRLELGMRQVIGGIGNTAFAPRTAASAALDALLQRREVQLQRFDTKDYVAKVSPTDAEIEAHFKAHEAQYRLPEEAKIEYVVLDVDALTRDVSVTEDELRKYYAENTSRYTVAEERRASHVLIAAAKEAPAADRQKAKARAEELLAQVRKAPGTFAEVARKNSQDPGSAVKGGDLDFFGRGAMVKPFEDTVFAMKPGEISNVVETDFGYHVIRLDAVRGGDKRPFEAVRAEIEAEVKRSLAQRRFAEGAETFSNTVYEQPDSLQPVIDKFKLARQTATVQRTPAPGAQGVLAAPKFLEAVFGEDALRNKRNTSAVDLGGNRLASARVLEHLPSRLPPLADVKDRVRAAVAQEQAAALARKAGQALLELARKGSDAPLAQTLVVSRRQAQEVPPPVLEAVLQADPGKLPQAGGVDLGPAGYAVIRVTKVLPREDAGGADASLVQQVAQAWGNAEAAAYYEALKKRYKVELKPAATAAAAADGSASAPGR
jgi:peptidyl-prolyl cis-trans isomerase D